MTADSMYVDLEDALVAKARAAGALSSSTSKGRAREHILGETLTSCLPSRLSAERGEVIDRQGRRSGEADLVVVDTNRGRRIVGGESFVPVEAAIAVLEVKSSVKGAELESAIKKIARVKSLTREPATGMHVMSGEARIPIPPRSPLGVIFAYSGPSRATIQRRIGDNPTWYGNDVMMLGPDVIAIAQDGVLVKNDFHLLAPPPGAENNAYLGDTLPTIQVISQLLEALVQRYGNLTYPPY